MKSIWNSSPERVKWIEFGVIGKWNWEECGKYKNDGEWSELNEGFAYIGSGIKEEWIWL